MPQCIECEKDIEKDYFCTPCYWLHSNIHIRLRRGGICTFEDCEEDPDKKQDVFTWTKCSHTACVSCYKSTPHRIKYKVERSKNPNSRCPVCAKIAKENCKLIRDGGNNTRPEHIQTET